MVPPRDGAIATPPGLDAIAVAAVYDEPVPDLLLAAKNGGRRDVLVQLGRSLASIDAVATAQIDAVTWVPASRTRRRRRGYDQGEILAAVVARRLGRPSRRLLSRPGRRDAQAGRNRARRLTGPTLETSGPVPPSVLLVDDVMTTGGSLAAAATALRRAGADSVRGAVVAAVVDGFGFTGGQHRQLDIGGRTWT